MGLGARMHHLNILLQPLRLRLCLLWWYQSHWRPATKRVLPSLRCIDLDLRPQRTRANWRLIQDEFGELTAWRFRELVSIVTHAVRLYALTECETLVSEDAKVMRLSYVVSVPAGPQTDFTCLMCLQVSTGNKLELALDPSSTDHTDRVLSG